MRSCSLPLERIEECLKHPRLSVLTVWFSSNYAVSSSARLLKPPIAGLEMGMTSPALIHSYGRHSLKSFSPPSCWCVDEPWSMPTPCTALRNEYDTDSMLGPFPALVYGNNGRHGGQRIKDLGDGSCSPNICCTQHSFEE